MNSIAQAKISILVAAYKAAQFLPTALASIAVQTIGDWELLVVEDGPGDDTESLVNEFARQHDTHRIIYDRLATHRGVAAARNRSLDLSKGQIIAFLDADDLWESNHLANLVEKLEEGHVLVCSPIRIWDGADNKQLCVYAPTSEQIRNPRRGLFESSFIQTSSCVAMPRKTVERVGRFDESLTIGEDRDYWFRAVSEGGTLGCTDAPTCRYLKHSGSSMAKTLIVAEQAVKFYEKYRSNGNCETWLARRILADALRTYGRLFQRKDAKMARKLFLRAWRVWPLGLDLPVRAFLPRRYRSCVAH